MLRTVLGLPDFDMDRILVCGCPIEVRVIGLILILPIII